MKILHWVPIHRGNEIHFLSTFCLFPSFLDILHAYFHLQELSNKESLLKYCRQYGEASSPTKNNCVCLRLDHLSITRIGCIDRLLWVQMLDLSYNELRSIEGTFPLIEPVLDLRSS